MAAPAERRSHDYGDRVADPTDDPRARKDELRHGLIAARTARPASDRARAAAANGAHLAAGVPGGGVICAYLPLPSEPLAVALLDVLVGIGCVVLVPVVTADSPLDWCNYPSPSIRGPFGIAEPTGPRLGPSSVLRADVVLVPALAVDRSGHRLGRGGGHYDRTLALLRSGETDDTGKSLIAVLFDDELLDLVPAENHDRPVTAVVTPTAGIRQFRR